MAKSLLEILAPFHSWHLSRFSPLTFPQDIITTLRRHAQPMTQTEIEAIVRSLRGGTCYRCRIGKGRYFFGTTPEEAAKRCADATRAKRSK